jgi:hypothetical protein
MSETSPLMKNAVSFLVGCLFMVAVFYLFFKPRLESIQDSVSSANTTNQNTIAQLQATISDMYKSSQEIIKQRDTCNAKFDRATILYDVGMFNNETRAWVIPADVEPMLASNKNGSYSHYDHKTQTETVHFKGKRQ